MTPKNLLLSVLIVALSGTAAVHAETRPAEDMPVCAAKIADMYQVPLGLLQAIRDAENGTLGKESKPNRDGSRDIGPMQINSKWLQTLSDGGITRDLLTNDYCTNVVVGAWVLRTDFDATGNWQEAVAAYNAGQQNRQMSVARAYAARVMAIWKRYYATSTDRDLIPDPKRKGLRVVDSAKTQMSRLVVFEP